MLDKLLRLNPSFYTLIGGALISVGVNVYTGVATTIPKPSASVNMVFAAVLAFASGILFAAFALKLDSVQRLAYQESPDWIKSDEIWATLVKPKRLLLCLLLMFAVGLGISGLFMLQKGFSVEISDMPAEDVNEVDEAGKKTTDTQDEAAVTEIEAGSATQLIEIGTDIQVEEAEVISQDAGQDSTPQIIPVVEANLPDDNEPNCSRPIVPLPGRNEKGEGGDDQ